MFAAHGLPAGLHINPYTGFIFGTIDSSAVSGTPHAVSIMASDGTDTTWIDLNWTVNAGGTVTLANPGDQTNNDGDTVSLSLTATDSTSGATLRFLAFGLPPGLSINTSTGAITGTVALGAAAVGPYTVTVVANDGTDSATQTFVWNVNSPIAVSQLADQVSAENASVSVSISATDYISGSTMCYAAAGLPPGLRINPSTGVITGTVAKGAAANGPYSVTVIVEDGTHASAINFNWDVTSPVSIVAPDGQSFVEAGSVSFNISAADATSGTLTFSAVGLPAGLAAPTAMVPVMSPVLGLICKPGGKPTAKNFRVAPVVESVALRDRVVMLSPSTLLRSAGVTKVTVPAA